MTKIRLSTVFSFVNTACGCRWQMHRKLNVKLYHTEPSSNYSRLWKPCDHCDTLVLHYNLANKVNVVCLVTPRHTCSPLSPDWAKAMHVGWKIFENAADVACITTSPSHPVTAKHQIIYDRTFTWMGRRKWGSRYEQKATDVVSGERDGSK